MNTTTDQARISAVKFHGYKIGLTVNIKGQLVARLSKLITVGKNKGRDKCIEAYYFKDEQRREAWVKEQVTNISASIKNKIDRKAKNKAAARNHPFKVGDVVYSSWGYDQTNIDFFEIVAVGEKSVKTRSIGECMVEGSGGFMCERVTPDIGRFTGTIETKIVKAYVGSNTGDEVRYYVSNGRYSLSLYTDGKDGVYQSHYA